MVVLMVYAPGPGPRVGFISGGLLPVPKPISGSLSNHDVLLKASITVLLGGCTLSEFVLPKLFLFGDEGDGDPVIFVGNHKNMFYNINDRK